MKSRGELSDNPGELPEATQAEKLAYLQGLAEGLEYVFDLAKDAHEAVSDTDESERKTAIMGTLAIFATGIQRVHARVCEQHKEIDELQAKCTTLCVEGDSLRQLLEENAHLRAQVTSLQSRCTEFLLENRELRRLATTEGKVAQLSLESGVGR